MLATVPMFPTIIVRNTRKGFFEDHQLEAVLSRLPDYVQPLMCFLALTGWRIGEARKFEWKNIDFAACTMRLEPTTTKNDDGRTFPFGKYPPLKALLEEQRQRATTRVERELGRIIPLVFHRNGSEIRDHRTRGRPHVGELASQTAWRTTSVAQP